MDFESLFDIPIDDLHTPCYLTDARLLQKNTALLKQIQQRTGCKILLAQKAFSMFSAYPLIRDDLAGTTAQRIIRGKTGTRALRERSTCVLPCLHAGRFHTAAGTLRPYCIQLVWTVEKIQAAGARCNPEYFLRHSRQSRLCRSRN